MESKCIAESECRAESELQKRVRVQCTQKLAAMVILAEEVYKGIDGCEGTEGKPTN